MFVNEAELQQLVHEQPELILSGIPEINPVYCSDTPKILSLGREIPLRSGPIDNLYVDTNGIITLVECKTYSNSGIKRSVYSQAINYASDLQNMLIHYSGTEFIEQFYSIITEGNFVTYPQFDSMVAQLSQDCILEGKNKKDWKQQFLQRLEFNIKNGVFRIVILCAPSKTNLFSYAAVRNLMQLMTFSESGNSKYDLILMDLRGEAGAYQAQMIWRRYCPLPQIPLIANSLRAVERGIEAMRKRFSMLPSPAQATLKRFQDSLREAGIDVVENSIGYSLRDADTRKSMFISVETDQDTWFVRRHQIRNDDSLFANMGSDDVKITVTAVKAWAAGATRDALERVAERYKVFGKPSEINGVRGVMYEIWIYTSSETDIPALIHLLKSRLRYQTVALSPQPVLELATQ
ncbi:hypothetical protein H6F86_21620 [Phormidium sp. FACHB-592]|uniref:Uncharacterized protein n=1 Tax=Stenomitos frigidus AS-A4 TaxID=2933935 RepID=A0ABV0KFK2_9CYAN|nr:hypothetical protein [Phormidium sp. FACHB-592]MBD2076435.1 hypothetical protein [Phormidium sp. FACHB-592]